MEGFLRAKLVAAAVLTLADCSTVQTSSGVIRSDVAPVADVPASGPDAREIAATGERLFQERCSTCHDAGRAPPRSQIATNSPQQILEALDTGFMASVAMFMTAREKTIIARHLSNVTD